MKRRSGTAVRPTIELNEDLVHRIVAGFEGDTEAEELLVILAAVLISCCLTMLMIGLTVRRLAAPVLELTRQIERMDVNHGTLQPLSRDDEIGQLSRSFVALVERLQGFVRREREFSSFASHELRSPVTVLQGNLDILRQSLPDSPLQQRALQRMEGATRRMTQLIECFLWLSREHDSADRLLPEALTSQQLTALIDQVLDGVHAAERGRVRVDIGKLGWRANPMLLSVVLDNLLRNALFHGDGEVRVRADAEGMQVLNTMAVKEADEGFGVGLQIVQRICVASGWRCDHRIEADTYRVTIGLPPKDPEPGRQSSTQTSRIGSPKSS